MEGKLKNAARGLIAAMAVTFSLGFAMVQPSSAGVDCPASKFYSSIWGISTEGPKAYCRASTGGLLVRGHHHNWGRDLYTQPFNRTWTMYYGEHSWRAGWVDLDIL